MIVYELRLCVELPYSHNLVFLMRLTNSVGSSFDIKIILIVFRPISGKFSGNNQSASTGDTLMKPQKCN
jgi:hypothetical protein